MDYFDSEEDFSGSSIDEDNIEKDPDFELKIPCSTLKKKAKLHPCLLQSRKDQVFPETKLFSKYCEKCGYKLMRRADVYTHKCDGQDFERMHSAGSLNSREHLKPCRNKEDVCVTTSGLEHPILQDHGLESNQTKYTVDALPSANRIPLTVLDVLNNCNETPSKECSSNSVTSDSHMMTPLVSSSCKQVMLGTSHSSSESFSNVPISVGSAFTVNIAKKSTPDVSTTHFRNKSCIECRKNFSSVYDLKVHCLNTHGLFGNNPNDNNILPRPVSNMSAVTSIPCENVSNTCNTVPSMLTSQNAPMTPTSVVGYGGHNTLSSLISTPSASLATPSINFSSQQHSIIPQNFVVNVISYVGNCDATISTSFENNCCKKPKDCVVIPDEIKDCLVIENEAQDCLMTEDKTKDCIVIEDETKDCIVIEDETKDCIVIEDETKDCIVIEDEAKDCIVIDDSTKGCVVKDDPTVVINDCNKDMSRNSIPKLVSCQSGKIVNTNEVQKQEFTVKSTPVHDSILPEQAINYLLRDATLSSHLKHTVNESCAVEDLQGSQNLVPTALSSESIHSNLQKETQENENGNLTNLEQFSNNVTCISLNINTPGTTNGQQKTTATSNNSLKTYSVCQIPSSGNVVITNSSSIKRDIQSSNLGETGKVVSRSCVDALDDGRVLLEEQTENDIEAQVIINRFECTICKRKYPEEKQLDDHLTLKHADQKSFQCKSCGQKYSSRKELETHIINTCLLKNKGKKTCLKCGKVLPSKCRLLRHENEHISGRRFKCKVCNRIYISWHYFNNHSKSHLTEKALKCDKCDRRFTCKQSVYEHIQAIHINAPMGTCDICGKSFKTNKLFKVHYKRHSKDKPHKCNTCGALFAQLHPLKMHLLKHTGEKPHMCDICGLKFRLRQNLIKHSKKHTGQKPYNCDICGRGFTEKGDVKRHMFIHSKDKPYHCSICNQKFSQQASISRHVRVVHKKLKRNADAVNHELVNS